MTPDDVGLFGAAAAVVASASFTALLVHLALGRRSETWRRAASLPLDDPPRACAEAAAPPPRTEAKP